MKFSQTALISDYPAPAAMSYFTSPSPLSVYIALRTCSDVD